jgi:hypothetical protein
MKRAIACLVVAIVGLQAGVAAADCCNDCGCQCQCCKVCRCVPEIKKVPKITYCCECQDFCIPGPSKICGYTCVCPDECECSLFHHAHKEPIWQPTCAKVHTRHVLVKKETIKEVPGWKWEVVDLCPKCKTCCKHASAGQPAAAPVKAVAEKSTLDYYSQNEELTPVAQPAPATQPAAAAEDNSQKAELVSHTTPTASSKLKRMLLPMLAK